MHEVPATLGVVLAGGLSRRMGGGDKGLNRIGGRTILAIVAERLRPQCAAVILNANGDPARFAELWLIQIPDTVASFPGPLAGLLAALEWAAENRPELEWVASAAGDTPFLPADYVSRLHAARLGAGLPVAVAASGGREHPVNGLWPVSLRHNLRRALVEDGERRVGKWVARQGAATASWECDPVDPFFNVNEPADLAEARRVAEMIAG